jgi:hypothetical protein
MKAYTSVYRLTGLRTLPLLLPLLRRGGRTVNHTAVSRASSTSTVVVFKKRPCSQNRWFWTRPARRWKPRLKASFHWPGTRGICERVTRMRCGLCRPPRSDDHGHQFHDGRGDRLLVVLRHDHDPQRLDTSAAPSEIGSIIGRHRPGRFLTVQALHQDIRPSTT